MSRTVRMMRNTKIKSSEAAIKHHSSKIKTKSSQLDDIKKKKKDKSNTLSGHDDCYECYNLLASISKSYSEVLDTDAKDILNIDAELGKTDTELRNSIRNSKGKIRT